MGLVILEIPSALGAVASIASLARDLWQEHKRQRMENGRKSE